MGINHTTSKRNPTEQKVLELLGTGLRPEIVASAVGVTPGRISQLLSDPEFADAVTELRVGALQKHNVRDNQYDSMEDDLMTQFRTVMPMMMRPLEILKGIQVINAAKRRGTSTPDQIQQSNVVVTIVMPVKIVQHFTTNSHNQVIEAGDQKLVTIQSGQMQKVLEGRSAESQKIIPELSVAEATEKHRMDKIKEGVRKLNGGHIHGKPE